MREIPISGGLGVPYWVLPEESQGLYLYMEWVVVRDARKKYKAEEGAFRNGEVYGTQDFNKYK